MKTTRTKHVVVASMVLLLTALSIQPAQPVQSEDSHVKGTMVFTPIEELGVPIGDLAVMASGAAEDTLKACMARIPALGSIGQYMLAEQSCVGEERTRKAIHSAPKF